MNRSRIFVSTIEDSPGRVHIAMFQGHGADQVAMRTELSVAEMQHMHEILTKALWDRLRQADRDAQIIRHEMLALSKQIVDA